MRLHTFSMFGMPRLPPEERRHWEIGEGSDSSLVIEKSWKELVPGHKVGLEHRVCPSSIIDAHRQLRSALEGGERPWEVGSRGENIWRHLAVGSTPGSATY